MKTVDVIGTVVRVPVPTMVQTRHGLPEVESLRLEDESQCVVTTDGTRDRCRKD